MAEKIDFDWNAINNRAKRIAREITSTYKEPGIRLYGVPRGGVYAALAVRAALLDLKTTQASMLVEEPEEADVIIDDVIDSGATCEKYEKEYPVPFLALCVKGNSDDVPKDVWVSFPWERMISETGAEENITRILQSIGEDPEREGLRETPRRVVQSFGELYSGYKADVGELIKTFAKDGMDEMVISRNIEFYSTCEHHMLPFIGKAHVAYIPSDKIIGLSKLARVVEIFSRRLQVQERLTSQITAALDEHLKPMGSACIIEAQHLCVMCRGVRKQSSDMVTSSLTGVFRKPEVRAEFISLLKQ